MKKIKDATVITGKYQKDGKEKNKYLTVGAVFQRDDGSMCMKLEALPVTFDGWINFYEPDFKKIKETVGKPNRLNAPIEDEEIPF